MRILISAFGTRGDVQPMVALARVLAHRRHEVLLFVPPNFAAWARRLGLDPIPVGTDFEQFFALHGEKLWGAIPTVKREIRLRIEAMQPFAETADVFLSAAVCVSSSLFADRYRKPGRYIAFSPSLMRSDDYPSPMTPWQRLPRPLNHLSWQVEKNLWNLLFLRTFNQVRTRAGAPMARDAMDSIRGQVCIIASEKTLAAPGSDHVGAFIQTGAWFFDDPEEVPTGVEVFLQAGSPPVFIGFGSMTDSRPAETIERLFEAIRLAKVRAIIARGWAGLEASELPAGVMIAGTTPHAKVFPRCAAVVHHGGAGTLHQALRAGVPQIVAPHLVDQFFWSERLGRAGLTPGALVRADIDPARFASLLRRCVDDQELRTRCREFARGMELDGLDKAVALIEGLKK